MADCLSRERKSLEEEVENGNATYNSMAAPKEKDYVELQVCFLALADELLKLRVTGDHDTYEEATEMLKQNAFVSLPCIPDVYGRSIIAASGNNDTGTQSCLEQRHMESQPSIDDDSNSDEDDIVDDNDDDSSDGDSNSSNKDESQPRSTLFQANNATPEVPMIEDLAKKEALMKIVDLTKDFEKKVLSNEGTISEDAVLGKGDAHYGRHPVLACLRWFSCSNAYP